MQCVGEAPPAEGDCVIGGEVIGAALTGVGADPAGHVDGEDRGIKRQRPRQVAGAAESEDAVDDQVVVAFWTVDEGAAGVAECLQRAWLGGVESSPGIDVAPGHRELGAGVECVAAVATLAHEQQNPALGS